MSKEIDIHQIIKILPHRYPFLLVDRILEYEPRKRAVAIKNVTMNEPQFQGHFPGLPIMPGVLLIEAMAQVGAVLFLQEPEAAGRLVFFAGIDNVRFRRPVVPGDQLRIEVEILWVKKGMGRMKGVSTVDGKNVVEGELLFSLAPADLAGANVHPSAIVHPRAQLGKGVVVGPYVHIGHDVVIGEKTQIAANAVIHPGVRMGIENRLGEGTVLGTPPQDTKYKGEKSFVEIGDRNVLREYVTIHAATGEGAATKLGNDCFMMAHAHLGHNCEIGNEVTITIQSAIGGHCVIEDQATIGGLVAVHQFVRIGKLAMVGGMSRIPQDIPPYLMVVGNPATVRGLNTVGITRRGVSKEAISELKSAYKTYYRSGLSPADAIVKMKKEVKSEEGKQLVAFLEAPSKRGVLKKVGSEDESGEEA